MARITAHEAAIRQLLDGPEVHQALGRKANQVMRAAISSAPVDTGDYRSKFSIRGGKDKKGLPVVYVGNDDPAAAHIEWGTKHSAFGPTPAHHTMARAMSSAREG